MDGVGKPAINAPCNKVIVSMVVYLMGQPVLVRNAHLLGQGCIVIVAHDQLHFASSVSWMLTRALVKIVKPHGAVQNAMVCPYTLIICSFLLLLMTVRTIFSFTSANYFLKSVQNAGVPKAIVSTAAL